MSSEETLFVASNAVIAIFTLSMPTIAVATVVGLVIALLQTLIQLQEQTLAFAAKLIAVVLMLFLFGGSMATQLLVLMEQMMNRVLTL